MKGKITTLAIGLLTAFVSCNKVPTCEAENAICEQQPNTNGITCQAYFESWFFNPTSNTCELIGYSGCSKIGFESKVDCEACICSEK